MIPCQSFSSLFFILFKTRLFSLKIIIIVLIYSHKTNLFLILSLLKINKTMLFKHLLILSVIFILSTALASSNYEDHCLVIYTDLKRCMSCENEFFLTQTGTCIQLSSLISSCSSYSDLSLECTQCERGYYLSTLTSRNECN